MALRVDPASANEIAMRSLSTIRNYCLLVFFLVLIGGVVLQPANHEAQGFATDKATTVQAGFAP